MAATKNQSLEGMTCLVSGSGNVAQYACEKLLDMGAKPVTFSDSSGIVHDPDGIDRKKLAWVMDLKNVRRGRIKEYTEQFKNASYTPIDPSMDHNPLWSIPADSAFPSATQNEINAKDAQNLVDNGVKIVSEGANMPSTPEAMDIYLENGILYGLGKAANAGGVAVSALEMSQNSMRYQWTREEVDNKLKQIMQSIHDQAYEAAKTYGAPGNYVVGANVAGFLKVANSMMDQGIV
jgi:glutamate dehydrogenase (NADP+)